LPRAVGVPHPDRVTKRRAWVLLAAAAWTCYVWGTRLYLLWGNADESTAFKVVHTVLAGVSLVFAAAVAWIGYRGLRESRAGVPA